MTALAAPDRRGAPAPLIFHLASAAEIFETGARLAPVADAATFPWSGAPTPEERALAASVAAAPSMETAVALRLEGARRLEAMLRGLRRYQESPHRRTLPDPPVVWSRGAARLLDFGGPPGAPVALLAPSLVNRWHILDLEESHSLVRHLAEAGLRPLMLDWGEPAGEELGFDLNDYLEQRLAPAFDHACALGGGSAALVGYCMGGTLAAALAAARPGAVSRLAMIGAPWDFSAMIPMRGALASLGLKGDRTALTHMLEVVRRTFGAVPVSALQTVFAQLDPGLAARKFRRFAAIDESGDEARRFVLIEDWLNGGPPLSGPAARQAMIDWHCDNAPSTGGWRAFGAPVDPGRIEAPVLVVAARDDRIVPPAAAEPIAEQLQSAQIIRPPAGHIGMVVGREARARLWRPLAAFLSGRSC